MTEFGGLLARLSRGLRAAGLPFMVIGGQAVLIHGSPRLTEDVDITLGAGPDAVGRLLEACQAMGLEPLPQDPAGFARDTFVLPCRDRESEVRVDLILSTLPYERQAIERAESHEVGGEPIPYASAEDLIIHKLFAGRPRDLEDATGVAVRGGDRIDWSYVERWVASFSEVPGREDLVERLSQLRQALD